MTWGATGWLVIAAIGVVAAAALHPSTALAGRFLSQHGPGVPSDDPLDQHAPPVPAPSMLEDPPLSTSVDGYGPPTARQRP